MRLTRQERGRSYTVFVDSTSAIDRVRDDELGPGQRFAVVAIEVCSRIIENDNSVTIRRVPAPPATRWRTGTQRVRPLGRGRWRPYLRDTPLRHPFRTRRGSQRRPDPRRQESGSRRMFDPSEDIGPLRGEASDDHHSGGPERPSQAATTSSYRGMRRRAHTGSGLERQTRPSVGGV